MTIASPTNRHRRRHETGGPDALAGDLDANARGIVFPVRNQTLTPLLKGRAVAVAAGEPDAPFDGFLLVQYADKDDPARRPAIGLLTADVPASANGTAISLGILRGLNTAALALTDQLVLGNGGNLIRPPPETTPFTGEVQLLASVSRVHATLGEVVVTPSGLLPAPDVGVDEQFTVNGSTASGTYTTLSRFIYGGSTILGKIVSLRAVANMNAGTGKIRVFDLTSGLVIAETLAVAGTTPTIYNLGAISNVPTGVAILEVQAARITAGTITVSSLIWEL